MLLPKRVKYRRQHRGRMKGAAHKGNYVAYGDFGLQALEPSWITSNQIEAARIAMTRYIKRGGQFEIGGVSEELAREAMRLAMYKLQIKCKFIKKEEAKESEK